MTTSTLNSFKNFGKKVRKTSFRHFYFIFCVLTTCITSCSSTQSVKNQPKKSSYHLPPSEWGVRTTAQGLASAEISISAEKAFDIIEIFLRKEYKVSFVNRSLGKIEAETKSTHFTIDLSILTTGKTGLTISAISKSNSETKFEAARDLANTLVAACKEASLSKNRIP